MEGEDREEVCIGRLCFQRPHLSYVPPSFYPRISQKKYKWKVQATIGSELQARLKCGRACVLPDCLGLGDDGRWRWGWLPVFVLVGLKTQPCLQNEDGDNSVRRPCILPYVRLKSLTPMFGKLALQPLLELSTVCAAEIRREFSLGHAKVAIRASVKAHNVFTVATQGLCWTIQLQYNPKEAEILKSTLTHDEMKLTYLRRWTLSKSCKLVASASPRLLCLSSQESLWAEKDFVTVKLSHKLGVRDSRDKPLPTSAYLKASENFGRSSTITITPGHWIDPADEYGAPGEREFNLEVANLVERQLSIEGWEVLRPDRDAPYLSWERYLNWLSNQTQKGHPVLEIHGQGSTADFRGHIFGVIGDPNTSLNKELAKEFGIFDMDWTGLAVPRRGGVIVESFNSDEVLQMGSQQRSEAVRCVAHQLVSSIERVKAQQQSTKQL